MRKLLFGIILLYCFRSAFGENSIVSSGVSDLQGNFFTDNQVVLGTLFTTGENARLLNIQFQCNPDDPVDHSVRLWEKTGNQFTLVNGPFIWNILSGSHGWHEFEFQNPVTVYVNKTYLISIGYIPILNNGDAISNTGSGGSVKTSNQGVVAENGGATIPTSWFLGNSSRIAIISNIKFKAGKIGPDQTICYNNKPSALLQLSSPSGGTGIYSFQWQSSSDSINWQDVAGARYAVYTPSAITHNTFYRRIVSSGAFGSISSNYVLITVLNRLLPGAIGLAQTVCYNTAPSGLTEKTSASGGTGLYNYQWQTSNDNILWGNIPGANGLTFQPLSLTSNSWFRRNVTSGDCEVVSTNAIQIKVNPLLNPGNIGTNQTICYNSTPSPLTNISSPSGGMGVYIYQWQSSPDNSNWNNISGATQATYSPPSLSSNTWYRRKITNDPCNLLNSNSVQVTVNPSLIAGSIGSAQRICYNSIPEGLTQTAAPSGGTGTYVYQWQSSPDNNAWTNISGATLANYSPAALTSTVWFRYRVTSGNCGTVSSNSVEIIVYPAFTAGSVGPAQSICYNEVPASLTQLTASTGGDGTFSYQWQSSANNSVWADIDGAGTTVYSPSALAANVWYRRNVTSTSCGTISSNVVPITVNPTLTSGSIGTDQTICSNSIPAALTQSATPSGGTGTYSYQWQSSSDNTTWSNITGATLATYSPSALTASTWFRRNVKSGDCVSVNSNSVLVTVTPALNAGTIGSPQSICYNTIPSALTQLTPPTGGSGVYTYQWQSSPDNINWTNISGAAASGYSSPSLTSTTWFRRNVTDGQCGAISSSSIRITVYLTLTPGTIGSDQAICSGDVPVALTQITAASGGSGTYTYQWQSSSDNLTWTAVSGATSTTYSPPALTSGSYFRRTVTSGSCGTVSSNSVNIVVNPTLLPGSIGSDQSICYNTSPSSLTQLSAPSGGSGSYGFQWQRSNDNSTWTTITGASSSAYSPASLTSGTWFRRGVTSNNCSATSNPVHITIFSVISLAQLHDTKKIPVNTSTTFNIVISGGTSPFIINYTLNGSAQSPISAYTSGNNVSTGILAAGTYTYTLTTVTDANGCRAQDLGTSISITAGSSPTGTPNTALVVVNSSSANYTNYTNYIEPYLENFGIPYDVCNINTTSLPVLSDYAVIIFGHRNVYTSGYPISLLESAVSGGTGLYSFDPHLFDYASSFNSLISQVSVTASQITMPNYTHYITQNHAPDSYNGSNNIVNLRSSWNVVQNSSLTGGTSLATMTSGGQTVSLLQVTSFGSGRVVRWCGYDWVFESVLGPVYGMDDLIWRGIVWAARKPFVMQGLPPMLTMRIDDADGTGSDIENNFTWVSICNEFGIIPWLGLFTGNIPPSYVSTLKTLIDNNHATASPHAYGYATSYSGFIYYNHDNITGFDPAAKVREARNFFTQNGLTMSKYVVPHYYEYASASLPEVKAMGVEFLGIHWLPDLSYNPAPAWINCGPYRINRNGTSDVAETRPVYYGGYVNLSGVQFFDCLTEIRDDGGYEWFPDNSVFATSARGIRHLRRAFNSMVLASLFTHEQTYIASITIDNWREILREVTTGVSGFAPEYTTTDYALKYIRAKSNLRITNVIDHPASVDISYSGSNDMNTKCYLFTEPGSQIIYSFVTLPQVNGNGTVSASK